MKTYTVYCQPKYHDALFKASITDLNARFGCKFNIDPNDIDRPFMLTSFVDGFNAYVILRALQDVVSSVDKASESLSSETKPSTDL